MKRDLQRPQAHLVSVLAAVAVAALCWALHPFAAAAAPLPSLKDWHEVRVPGFVVVTDGDEALAGALGAHLSELRSLFAQVWPIPEPSRRQVYVLAVSQASRLRLLLPTYWESCDRAHPEGAFVHGLDRDYLVVAVGSGSRAPFGVLDHEFGHILVDEHFGTLPPWLDEGLAEFVALGEPLSGRFGAASENYLKLLRSRPLLPLDALFRADRRSDAYTSAKGVPIFYAESWALVHYLALSNGGLEAPRLSVFVSLLRSGTEDTEAAKTAFGDFEALGQRVKAYVNSRFLPSATLSVLPFGRAVRPETRRLSQGESALLLGDLFAATNRPGDAASLLSRHDFAELEPEALERLSLSRLHEQAFDLARLTASRAIAANDRLAIARYVRAVAVIASNQSKDPALFEAAEQDLRDAIRRDPALAAAYATLGALLAETHKDPAEALVLAKRGVDLDPSSAACQVGLDQVLLMTGMLDEAKALAARIVRNARSPREREVGQALLLSAISSPPPTDVARSPH